MKEKAYELRQRRATLLDESRELIEKAERDNRAMTKDEQARHAAIVGGAGPDGKEARGEANELAERISQIERQIATDAIGFDPGRRSDPLPHEDPGAAKGRTYSIARAIACCLGRRAVDGLEGEVSQEIAKRTQKVPQGFLMPFRTSGVFDGTERRAMDSVTAGGATVQTTLSRDWIELLRNSMKVKAAGAREIMDLQGKFALPRQSAASTAYWVAEGGGVTPSNPVTDQVLFTPHTIGALTDINRRFFELTNIGESGGEDFVKEDLAAVVARGIDLAALNGSGSSNQPLGLLQNTAITSGRTVSLGNNGGVPTWATVVEMHTIVGRGNALDLGETSYMGNIDVESTLATTAKIGSTFPVFLLEDNKVRNRPFHSTQQLPSNLTKGSSGATLSPLIYGVWNQLILAYWSGVDVLVDPYTGSSSGTVRIVALQDMDIQARHNEAWSFIVDMITNQSS